MKLKLYQIDAFTDKVFGGNPAAVCILEHWIDEDKMQSIASENNLAETAFVVKEDGAYQIRWFTPSIEVDLCGHATLAAAFVLFEYYNYSSDRIDFQSHTSGLLSVYKNDDAFTLNFPTDKYEKLEILPRFIDAFGLEPIEAYKGKTDYLLIYQSQKIIEEIQADIEIIKTLGGRGVIISAKGDHTDFVSRFFAPQAGVDEDPVTGSAHTTLTPVWSKKLNKTKLTAKQLSKRQGDLICEYLGERVEITGKAISYLIGEINI